MTRRARHEIPAGFNYALQPVVEWRGSHSGRRPIPESLWALAAELASQHGVFRTAQVVRLDYTKLKQRTQTAVPAGKRSLAPPAAFRRTDGALRTKVRMRCRSKRGARTDAHRMKRSRHGPGWPGPNAVGVGRLVQITPQIRILVAVEPSMPGKASTRRELGDGKDNAARVPGNC
jgi:hypothetical protein